MDKKLSGGLVESMTQMNEIVRGERAPSRELHIDARALKRLRAEIGLSQPKLASLMSIDVGTLRNWEQGRREPTGPAKALLVAIAVDAEARAQGPDSGSIDIIRGEAASAPDGRLRCGTATQIGFDRRQDAPIQAAPDSGSPQPPARRLIHWMRSGPLKADPTPKEGPWPSVSA